MLIQLATAALILSATLQDRAVFLGSLVGLGTALCLI